jgi:drug/metabolite transporter (DMT)-like permease
MLLRNIGFPHRFQRVVAFVMLNFGVYITLVNVFGNNIQQIVSFGIVWSLISSAIMVSSEGMQKSLNLTRDDYITRAAANVFASLCNVYFIIMLPFSAQLRFSIAFFYLGLQLFLILFGVKKVIRGQNV